MLSNTLHKPSRELFQNYIASQGFKYGLVIILETLFLNSAFMNSIHTCKDKTFSSKQKKDLADHGNN